MSENSLDYAEMIEIPVNTCQITYKRVKKSKKAKDDLKKEVLEKVNKKLEDNNQGENNVILAKDSAVEVKEIAEKKSKKTKKVKVKDASTSNVVMVEFLVVCALCAVIFLTNIFMQNSGINTFLRSAFSPAVKEQVDNREYSMFDAKLPVREQEVVLEEGVMTLAASASLYAPCNGSVTDLKKSEDGNYIIEIAHNNKFKTIISGVSFAYYKLGDKVYADIPVGYGGNGTKIYMYSNGELLSNYNISAGDIIWQV